MVPSLVESCDEKPKSSRIRCWSGLHAVTCRAGCWGPLMMSMVMSGKASSRRSAVGRSVARWGLPASSPASLAPSAAHGRRTTNARSVNTRNAIEKNRMRPVAWSSRCPDIGVRDSGWPFSRPTRRATWHALREANTACASDSCSTGWPPRSKRRKMYGKAPGKRCRSYESAATLSLTGLLDPEDTRGGCRTK
jgi:hypothetical protein